MLPSPGAKINLPVSGGAGGNSPLAKEGRTGARSSVAEGRAKSCVEGVAASPPPHPARIAVVITKNVRIRNIVASNDGRSAIVSCGPQNTPKFSGWQSPHFGYNTLLYPTRKTQLSFSS